MGVASFILLWRTIRMSERSIEVRESLPIVDEGDVVVVGGGTSGFVAATAAARTGARTILVERFGYLGGCTTAPYNTGLSSFYNSEGNQVIRGIPWEFMKRMEADGQCLLWGNGRNQLWPVWTRKVALDMVLEAGVELHLHTWVSGAVMEGAKIRGLVVQNKGGRGVILGKTFVDASGDADLAAFAGAPFGMADVDDLQQVSCDYIACGVDPTRVVKWARENREKLGRVNGLEFDGRPAGVQPMLTVVIPRGRMDSEGFMVRQGVMPTIKLCIYREAVRIQGNVDIDPLDPRSLTRAEVDGLRGALEHLEHLRATVPGFENAFVVAQSHLGVRETRRIVADYVITINDLKEQRRFKDVVALNCRGLDYHLKGTVFKWSPLKGHHDVPLRSLIPRDVANLVVAGRCIGCDHLSQASLRGAATCMATGHAAGTVAALSAIKVLDIRDLDVGEVQARLIEQDAILEAGGS
jgi:hypothetical protein